MRDYNLCEKFQCRAFTFKTSHSGKTSQPCELKIEKAHLGEYTKT